jgi:hypothetical protein
MHDWKSLSSSNSVFFPLSPKLKLERQVRSLGHVSLSEIVCFERHFDKALQEKLSRGDGKYM